MSTAAKTSLQPHQHFLDRMIFEACRPGLIPWLRIGFAILVGINTLVWMRDGSLWFSDIGVLTAANAMEINQHERYSLLFILPATPEVVQICLGLMLANCGLLLLGLWSRFQMLCLFVWLVSFQFRNPMLCDGEDTLFRCFAFYMMFLPLDCGWSVRRWWRQSRGLPVAPVTLSQTWAVSLMQFQMTVIYVSATWSKLLGKTWQDGTALYYVSHMHDHFGRIVALTPWFDRLWFVKAMTWSVLAIEGLLPILLWIPRTRLWGVALGVALHLGIELTMNLFLFEWLMILGLVTFLGRPVNRGSLSRRRQRLAV